MLNKLYDMGILGMSERLATADEADVGSKPSDIENKVTVSSIARRRLAVTVARLKMSETVSDVSISNGRGSAWLSSRTRLSGQSSRVTSESARNPSLTPLCSSPGIWRTL